jgi:hypothetical protein
MRTPETKFGAKARQPSKIVSCSLAVWQRVKVISYLRTHSSRSFSTNTPPIQTCGGSFSTLGLFLSLWNPPYAKMHYGSPPGASDSSTFGLERRNPATSTVNHRNLPATWKVTVSFKIDRSSLLPLPPTFNLFTWLSQTTITQNHLISFTRKDRFCSGVSWYVERIFFDEGCPNAYNIPSPALIYTSGMPFSRWCMNSAETAFLTMFLDWKRNIYCPLYASDVRFEHVE